MAQTTTGIIISPNPKAQQLAGELLKILPAEIVNVTFSGNMADTTQLSNYKHLRQFVAVGGDGACLKAMKIAHELSQQDNTGKPPIVFGLNCGHIGALSNPIGDIQKLPERIATTAYQAVYPLEVKATFREKIMYHTFFNEVLLKPLGNVTNLKIVWKDNIWYQKNIRGGIMVATKIGENAMNACNYTGPEPILTIPDTAHWRMSTLHAMNNDTTCDKAFQTIVPAHARITVDVNNPYEDRNAQLAGDSHYNDGEHQLMQENRVVGVRTDSLFVEKIKIASSPKCILLAREKMHIRS